MIRRNFLKFLLAAPFAALATTAASSASHDVVSTQASGVLRGKDIGTALWTAEYTPSPISNQDALVIGIDAGGRDNYYAVAMVAPWLTEKEVELLETRKWSITKIARYFRVCRGDIWSTA